MNRKRVIRWRRLGAALSAGLMLAGLAACAPAAPRASLLRASDLELTASDVVQQLAGSSFIRERSGGGAAGAAGPIVLVPTPMRNESDNRLSAGDQWAAMSLVLLDPAMLQLLREHNIVLQMPPEQAQRIARSGRSFSLPPSVQPPTHFFTTTLRSITRAGDDQALGEGQQRKDVFLWEYQIVDARTRAVAWSGSREFARIAHGSLID